MRICRNSFVELLASLCSLLLSLKQINFNETKLDDTYVCLV